MTATSTVLTVLFTSPVDQANVDVLWVTCTKVGLGTATLPLTVDAGHGPSLPRSDRRCPIVIGFSADRLDDGRIPRYAPPPTTTSPSASSHLDQAHTVAPSTTPATITAIAGTPQTVEVGASFKTLRVTVRDQVR